MNDNELSTERRHEIDALRVLALLALITMHSGLGFGPAAKWIGIPQNDVFLTWQKIPVSLFNLPAYANLLCDFGHGNLVFTDAYVY